MPDSLLTTHDWKLVLLAAVVCLLSANIGFWLYAKALRADRSLRGLWLGACAVAAGSGLWAGHFIGMLAFQPGMPTGYEATLTVASWLAAMAGVAVCFSAASVWRSLASRVACGAALGLVVAAMHFIGMAAFRIQGYLIWEKPYVLAAIALGAIFGAAALAIGGGRSLVRQACGAGLLATAVCLVHFTAMEAVIIVPDTFIPAPETLLSSTWMAAAVAGLVCLLVISALVAVAVEAKAQVSVLEDLREAIGAMADAVAFFDSQNRYVIWNAPYAEFARLAGVSLTPGLPFTDFLRGMLRKEPILEAVGREEEWLAERLARREQASGSSEHRFANQWLRVQERRTSRGGYISVVTDITDLRRQRDEAEAANRAKSEFLANMSHEIRTPLNGVIGVAQMLACTPMSAKQQEMIGMIDSSALTLQAVLGDILDMARIEAGKLDVSRERFILGDTVRDAAGLWRLQAEKKGLVFDIDIEPGAEGEIEADPMRLRQILTNLLSNAVKFTAQGSVSLTIYRPTASELVFEIRDTGIGFDTELAQRLFQRFEQADGSSTRKFGGTGLGLAICRELAERMGGSISARSRPGEGASFELRLPARALDQTAIAKVRSQALAGVAKREGARLNALVAEDHPINRKVLQLMLEAADVETHFVENGAEAVEAFASGAFDVVLMDMQMPVMDGLTAVRAIRDQERRSGAPPSPIIMLTAHAMPEHVKASHEAGADQHLAKPISAAALLGMLAEIAAGSPASRAA